MGIRELKSKLSEWANGYHAATSTFFYSVSKDGQRFLINHVESASEPVLNMVVNWEQALGGK